MHHSPQRLRKILLTILLGTTLEYYDIALFGFIAPILANVFLPGGTNTAFATMIMFAAYGVGILIRPLGSYIFGHIGDTKGRLKPLYFTTGVMALLSFAICLVPTYANIGISAFVIFTILKTMQQFCVSGYFNGGAIYCLEHSAGIYKPGFISGIYNAATVMGIVLAAAAAMLIAHYGVEYWRFGYILGIVNGFIAIIIRKKLPESPMFDANVAHDKSKKRKTNWKFSLSITATSLLFGLLYNFGAKILNVIIPEISTYTVADMLKVNFYVMVVYLFALILSGYLSDYVGIKRQMVITALISIPILLVVSKVNYESMGMIFAVKSLIIVLVAGFFAPAHGYYVSQLEVHKRYKRIGLLYTTGKVLAGFSPALFLYMWNVGQNMIYIMMLIGLVAVFNVVLLWSNNLDNKCM